MKAFIIPALVALSSSQSSFSAEYKVIGTTRDCPVVSEVIEVKAGSKRSLLVIHGEKAYTLAFQGMEGGIARYTSSADTKWPMTFEATIVKDRRMSSLSRLKIFLSGVMHECFIDK